MRISLQTKGFGPSATHSWATQPRWERSAAMVTRRTLGQNNSLSPSPTHLSHTTNIILSRIKCERYIFIKKCVRSFIEVLWKKLDGNYKKMLRAILNKSWRQHLTKQQLYGHIPPIMKTIQVKWTRHVGHCWNSRDELISDILFGPLHMDEQRQDNQLKPTFNSSVLIQDVTFKT